MVLTIYGSLRSSTMRVFWMAAGILLWNALLVPVIWASSASTFNTDWVPARMIDGVQVEAQATPSGINNHRAEVFVCTELTTLKTFITDISRFHEWIPDLEEVELIDGSASSITFYMKSRVPWPLKPRDMVYRLADVAQSGDSDELRISMTGLPDFLPVTNDAYRMPEAAGEWRITRQGPRIRVVYQLYLDPGPAPKFMANRRLAAAMGKTLANLAAHFACEPAI